MATRTVANGGGNFNATGTWVEGAVPTAADAVVFTATSGQLTVNVASVCLSIDFTNYTNTITFTNSLTVSGNITLAAGFTQAGASGIIINANSTLTSNGVTWSRTFTTSAGAGVTIILSLVGNWTQTGTTTFNSGGTATTYTTINSNSFIFGTGSYNVNITAATNVNGSATMLVGGSSGLVSFGSSNGCYQLNFTINTGGSVQFTGTFQFANATLTYTSGTVVTTGSTLQIPYSVSGQTVTFNTGSLVWTNVTFGSSGALITLTLPSNLLWSGSLTIQNAMSFAGTGKLTPANNTTTTLAFYPQNASCDNSSAFPSTLNLKNIILNPGAPTYPVFYTITLNGITININGGLNHTSGVIVGTAVFNFIGTGTLIGSNGGSGASYIQNNININTSGTITLGSTLAFNGGTFTYTAGTVVTTGNTLIMYLLGTTTGSSTTTLNTNGISWNNVILYNSTMTFVLNSTFTVTGLVNSQQNGTFIFAGTAGFVFNNFSQQYSSGFSMTLKAGNTYRINGGFYYATGYNPGHGVIKSDTTSSAAKLIFSYGAACNISYMDFTDIDASGGRTINIFVGATPVRCTNVRTYTDLPTIGS